MHRRILSMVLAGVLAFGTCMGAGIEASAKEAVETDGSLMTADNVDSWEEIASFYNEKSDGVVSETGEAPEIELASNDTYITYMSNGSVILSAKNINLKLDDISAEDGCLKITLVNGSDSFLAEYNFVSEGEKKTYYAKSALSSYDKNTELIFLSDNTEEIEPEELSSEACNTIKNSLNICLDNWDRDINEKTGASLYGLGFVSMFEAPVADVESESALEDMEELQAGTETVIDEDEVSEVAETEEAAGETESEIMTDTETEAVTETDIETTEAVEETETESIYETATEVSESEEVELEALPVAVVERISLNTTNVTIYEGDSFELKAYLFPENATDTVVFSSNNEGIASVSSNGIIKAISVGDTEVDATVGGVKATCNVHVIKSELTPEDALAYEGEEISEGIWMTGFMPSLTYTGSKITQNIRLYDHKKLLKEKTDYTISYANNTNAAPADILKSPSMTITMKGQYSGKVIKYFAIVPRDMSETTITTDNIALNYTGKEQKYVPTVYYGKKKLTNKKDFEITYTSGLLKGRAGMNEKVEYTLTGLNGNFTGTTTGSFYIADKSFNLSKAKMKINGTLRYTGANFKWSDLGIQITMPGSRDIIDPIVTPGYEITVVETGETWAGTDITSITAPGTYTIAVRATALSQFAGRIEKKIKVESAYNLTKLAEIDYTKWVDEIAFNKEIAESTGIIQPSTSLLKIKEGGILDPSTVLTMGTDYTVTYKNNNKTGKATVIFKGLNQYKGTISKTFRIVIPEGEKTTAVVSANAVYVTGGAIPDVTVTDKYGTKLVEKKDYIVTLKDNKKTGTASYKITGKGNYAKTEIINGEGTFNVIAASIDRCQVVVADKVVSTKAGAYKSVPVIYDINGKKLTAGKDYSKEFEYYYTGSELGEEPKENDTVVVKIKGIGNFEGSTVTGCYKIYAKEKNIAKLQIVVDPQYYTGQIVEPTLFDGTKGAIHVYPTATDKKNKTNEITATSCLRIVSYSNNIKTGNGKVVLAGTGEYGGNRTVTFSIKKKDYVMVRVDKVVLDSSELTSTLQAGIEGKDTAYLYAYVEPQNADNATLIWSSSNPSCIKIESIESEIRDGKKVEKAKVVAVGDGKSVIKVTSQDSGKNASVTVSSVKIAVKTIKISKTSLELSSGETADLTYTYTPENAYADKLTWYSTNESVATVDEAGHVTAKHGGVAYIVIKDMDKATGASDQCLVKVNEATSEMINVLDCGAVPNDNNTDNSDYTAFNKALNKAYIEGKSIYVPAGVYDITAKDSVNNSLRISDMSNISIVMDDGAVLKAIPNNEQSSRIVWIHQAENISITGGTIRGDLDEHIGDKGEGGHGVKIVNSKNVCISNVTIEKCCGDGVYVDAMSSNIDLMNCTLRNSFRHNVSLVGSQYVTFRNCKITNTKEHGCIDIEANGGYSNKHIKFIDCSISVSGGAALAILNSADDIVLTGSTISGGFITNRTGTNVYYNGRAVPIAEIWYP